MGEKKTEEKKMKTFSQLGPDPRALSHRRCLVTTVYVHGDRPRHTSLFASSSHLCHLSSARPLIVRRASRSRHASHTQPRQISSPVVALTPRSTHHTTTARTIAMCI